MVGGIKGVSCGNPCAKGAFRDQFSKEIKGNYNPEKSQVTEKLSYGQILTLLKISVNRMHFTNPFALSRSLFLEMSSGCAIIGSKTAPVEEVVQDSVNGLLVDFFGPKQTKWWLVSCYRLVDLLSD